MSTYNQHDPQADAPQLKVLWEKDGWRIVEDPPHTYVQYEMTPGDWYCGNLKETQE